MKTAKSEIEFLIAEINRCYWPTNKDTLVSALERLENGEIQGEWDNVRDYAIHKNKDFLAHLNVWAAHTNDNYDIFIICTLKALLLKDVIKHKRWRNNVY